MPCQGALTICMENPVIPGRIQMERFIPVEIFRKKSNTFRGITFVQFLPIRPKFFVPFVWLTSARSVLRRKLICFNPGPLVIWCFANGTTLTHSCFRKRFQFQYHLTEMFYRNFLTNAKRSSYCLFYFLVAAAS